MTRGAGRYRPLGPPHDRLGGVRRAHSVPTSRRGFAPLRACGDGDAGGDGGGRQCDPADLVVFVPYIPWRRPAPFVCSRRWRCCLSICLPCDWGQRRSGAVRLCGWLWGRRTWLVGDLFRPPAIGGMLLFARGAHRLGKRLSFGVGWLRSGCLAFCWWLTYRRRTGRGADCVGPSRRPGPGGCSCGLVVGGLIGLASLLICNALAFASPFRMGYSQVRASPA